MARNAKSFAVGNSRSLRLTPEISKLFIATISLCGRTTVAAQRCCISNSAAKDWLRKGREPGAEKLFRDFADGVARAKAEFLLLASRRLNQLAVGGLITLPAYDKTGSPIRRHEPDCAGIGPCQCELVMVEKVLLPNPNVLMWTMDRVDPQPREPEPEVPVSTAPELSDAEAVAEASQYFDLFRGGLKVLTDLGVPIAAILGETRKELGPIETTAAKVEPEPESRVSHDTQPSQSAAPAELEAAPAEPAPKPPEVPPKIYDAF